MKGDETMNKFNEDFEYENLSVMDANSHSVFTIKQIFPRLMALVLTASIGFGAGYGLSGLGDKSEISQLVNQKVDGGETKLLQNIVYEEDEDYISPITAVAMKAGPSIVTVLSTKEVLMPGLFAYEEYESEGTGSGVIYKINDDEMLIITNNHVVNEAKEVNIMFSSGEMVSADVAGFDSRNDLALVRVKADALKAIEYNGYVEAEFGDSEKLMQGELAVAMGNPLGKEYSQTVTSGVISAVDRTLSIDGVDLHVLQTDAAINPGNSGGGLLNRLGQVIGINTAKLVDSSVEGMGFAIPTHIVLPIIENIEKLGNGENIAYYMDDERAYLGISMESASESMEIFGVKIIDVLEDGPADVAGFEKGDIIVAADNKRVIDTMGLFDLLSTYKPEDLLTFYVLREDTFINIETSLGRYGDYKDE